MPDRSLLRPGVLAFLCGFVDTIVFVHMGGLFVAHVTGNFVLLGATIVGTGASSAHSETTLLQIASFPVFVFAAFVATLLHDRWPSLDARNLLWGVAGLVMVALFWSVFGAAPDVGASMLLVCAMATLNAAQRLAPGIGPPTTVMTGNTTQVAVSLARRMGRCRAGRQMHPYSACPPFWSRRSSSAAFWGLSARTGSGSVRSHFRRRC